MHRLYPHLITKRRELETKIQEIDAAAIEIPSSLLEALKSIDYAISMVSGNADQNEGGGDHSGDASDLDAYDIGASEEAEDQMDIPEDTDTFAAPMETGGVNPVAMTGKMRREMGEHAADFMDAYALTIHKRAVTFFSGLQKLLTLDTDNQLKQLILEEIGRRGLLKIEPRFPEWRTKMVAALTKDIQAMFDALEPTEASSEELIESKPTEEATQAEPAPELEATVTASAAPAMPVLPTLPSLDFQPAISNLPPPDPNADLIAAILAQENAKVQSVITDPTTNSGTERVKPPALDTVSAAIMAPPERPKRVSPQEPTVQEALESIQVSAPISFSIKKKTS